MATVIGATRGGNEAKTMENTLKHLKKGMPNKRGVISTAFGNWQRRDIRTLGASNRSLRPTIL